MTIKRGEKGQAWRYVPQGKINTLFGKEGLNKIRCIKCKNAKNESEFYHSSDHKPLSLCIECDDERRKLDAKIQRRRKNGIFVDKSLQPIPNLDSFFESSLQV